MAKPSLLMVHGAANGAWVWDAWRAHLKRLDWEVNVLDLRGHGRSLPVDMTLVTMEDYVADLESVTRQIEAARGRWPVVAGWSMGGLVAMMYAAKHPETPALLLFSPSPPLEIAGRGSPDEVRAIPTTAFGPEAYGIHPDDVSRSRRAVPDLTEEEAARVIENSMGAMESGFARRQRRRGVSVPSGVIRAPCLVVYGEEDRAFTPEQNRQTALYLGGDSVAVPGAGHWGVVYSETAVAATAPRVDDWLKRTLG